MATSSVRWNPQTYAGAGFATVAVDFHGSTGYGQAFSDAIRDDWGGAPYEDIVKGLDAALQQFPFLDGNKACALGASFGGYMVNWIAGQTDRFRSWSRTTATSTNASLTTPPRSCGSPNGSTAVPRGRIPSATRAIIRSTSSANGRRPC